MKPSSLRALAVVCTFGSSALVSVACDRGASPNPTPPQGTTSATASGQASASANVAGSAGPTVEDAKAFYDAVETELRKRSVAAQRAAWVNETYITDDSDQVAASAQESLMAYLAEVIPKATRFDGLTLPEPLARMHTRLKTATTLPAPLDAKKREELSQLSVSMTSTYGKGKFCPPRLASQKNEKDRCLDLGQLEHVMATSQKSEELLEAWSGWHAVGKQIRASYPRFVELANEGARSIGFADAGALWRSMYDMKPEAFTGDVERLWEEVRPLYESLHCYVRSKLRKTYPKEKLDGNSRIPAHLLGNMWAQEWETIYPQVEPYAGQPSLDVTKKLAAKKPALDEKGLVRIGEGFFVSLGMDPLPATFWERSLFKKPSDRDVVCHASAWDVSFDDDLRLKMCVEINEVDLLTVHHELGHDYYFHAYHKLPMLFQDGANDGFHEAIGDTLGLSVTPKYLKSIGLLDVVPEDEKSVVNVQLKRALERVAFLPFGKLIDQWRWDVFSGKTAPEQYNSSWWALRRRYQGIEAPTNRTDDDFDPGAKFHVASNTSYVRYFLAAIYQFQFHRALCKAAGHTGPLHTCSIYGSKEAGAKLQAMLAMGASKPWPEALAAISGDSGETKADAGAMLEYFAPLQKFLAEANKGETCGWEP